MNFFKSVFTDDPDPTDNNPQHPPNPDDQQQPTIHESPSTTSAWSFGGLLQTIATKSESVLETYKRDLTEFSSGLKKETDVIRSAIKDLPVSLETTASVAHDSLESVGQVIDQFGSSVWRGTTEIITPIFNDRVLNDLNVNLHETSGAGKMGVGAGKRYSRFEAQVSMLQCDVGTYTEEVEDVEEFRKWSEGFSLEGKEDEMKGLLEDNVGMEEMYGRVVPSMVEHEVFWRRYYYKVYKLKQVEDARERLVKRAISGEDEDLSWDVEEEEEEERKGNDEVSDVADLKGDEGELEVQGGSEKKKGVAEYEEEKKVVKESKVENCEVVDREVGEKQTVVESKSDNVSDENVELGEKVEGSEMKNKEAGLKLEEKAVVIEEKLEPVESCKDSDVSIVSTQPSGEEEDLGWDEIEDLGSGDERKVTSGSGGSPSRVDLRKRFSAAEDVEDLSWDIEDDDESAKSSS